MGHKTRSIFEFASSVITKIMPFTCVGILKDYWVKRSGPLIQPVITNTVVNTMNSSTIVTLGSCVGSLGLFLFYCKHYLKKKRKKKIVKLQIFCAFEIGTPIIMCKQDLHVKLGQIGTVVKKLSSKKAMVEFTLSSHFIRDDLIKIAQESYGEGLVFIQEDSDFLHSFL